MLASQALAQEKSTAPPEPETKLQSLEAATGVIIVSRFSAIGAIHDQLGTSAEVECRESTDTASGKKQYGITITVQNMSLGSKHTSYIDYDEIDSLLKGIDYISGVKPATELDKFQAYYRTKDDLTLSTFSGSGGTTHAGLVSGGVGEVLSLDQLAEFRALIQKARERLDSIEH